MDLPKILVILPRSGGGYVDKDVFGLIPGFSTLYAGHDAETPRRVRNQNGFMGLRYLSMSALHWDAAGLLSPVLEVERLLEKTRPTVVVTFEVQSVVTYQIEHSRNRPKFYHIVQAYETAAQDRGLWGIFPPTKILATRNSRGPDLFLAPSSRTLEMLTRSKVDLSRILEIPLGVYQEDFNPAGNIRKAGVETLLFLGALRRNKGLVTLISALDRIWPRDESSHRLVIAGSGPLSTWISRMSKARSWLEFENDVSDDRKRTLLGEATIFVYPSEDIRFLGRVRWEEQGAIAILEAMTFGLPVVSADSGAIREILPPENPIVAQASPESLARKIQQLLSDSEWRRRCSDANLRAARERFDIREHGRRLGQVLASGIPESIVGRGIES